MDALLILLGLLAVLVMPIMGWKGKSVFGRVAGIHRLLGLVLGAVAGVLVFFVFMGIGGAIGDRESVQDSGVALTQNADEAPEHHEERVSEHFAASVAESPTTPKDATDAPLKEETKRKAHRVGKRVTFPSSTVQILKATTFTKWKNPKKQDWEFCEYAYVTPDEGNYFVRVDLTETNRGNEVEGMASRVEGLGPVTFRLIDNQGNSASVATDLALCFHRRYEDRYFEVGTGRSFKSTMFFEVPTSIDKRTLLLQADFKERSYDKTPKQTEFLKLFKGS